MSADDAALAEFEKLFGPEFGHGRGFDLKPLHEALDALGAPHARLAPVIHVAGTNGKGSTIAFLRAMAEAAGLRAHAFTKPQLWRLRERFSVAGALASDDALIGAARRVKATGADVSQFEAQVAAAFLLFAESDADLVLLETGFGGRDDATNVIARPALSVLTPIDLDHQAILGETRAAIAAHKAGIIKTGAPAISARQHAEALAVLEADAARKGAPLLLYGRDWEAFAQNGRLVVQTETRTLDLPAPNLRGPHQFENAGLAAMAALSLPAPRLGEDAIALGVAQAAWPGRLQPLTRGSLAQRVLAAGGEVWVDGGHNAHGAAALARALAEMNRAQPRAACAIAGLRARKDAPAFVAALAPALAHLVAIKLREEESADPALLAAQARGCGVASETADSLTAAVEAALRAGAGRILICGSLALAAEALAAL